MRIAFLTLANSVSVNPDKSLDIRGARTHFYVREIPVAADFCLVVRFEWAYSERGLKVPFEAVIVSPDGVEIGRVGSMVESTVMESLEEGSSTIEVYSFTGGRFMETGRYEIKLLFSGQGTEFLVFHVIIPKQRST